MAVSSLDPTLVPSAFNSVGKIEIAAPGRDVFSSWPRPLKYKTISGTSMAHTSRVGVRGSLGREQHRAPRLDALEEAAGHGQAASVPGVKSGRGLVQAP
jgi:hypothetical protein